MEKQYIEIDSTYRNRNAWPSASEFEVPISQSGNRLKGEALDPISSMTSVKTWKNNLFDTLGTLINEREITLTIMDVSNNISDIQENNVMYLYRKDYNIQDSNNTNKLIFRVVNDSTGNTIHGWIRMSNSGSTVSISQIINDITNGLSDTSTGVQKFTGVTSEFQASIQNSNIINISNTNNREIQFLTDPNTFVVTKYTMMSTSTYLYNGLTYLPTFYQGETYTFIMDYFIAGSEQLTSADTLGFFTDSIGTTPVNPSYIFRKYVPGTSNCVVILKVPSDIFNIYIRRASNTDPTAYTYSTISSTENKRINIPLTTILGFDETKEIYNEVGPITNVHFLNYYPLSRTTGNINPPHAVSSGLQRLDGYYNNSVLEYGTGNTFRRIKEYKYLQNGAGLFVLEDHPVYSYVTPGNTDVTIRDPTNINQGLIFVPNGSEYKNSYNGMKLVNLNSGTGTRNVNIVSYDNKTSLLELDPNNSENTLWSNGAHYGIVKDAPMIKGIFELYNNNVSFDRKTYYYSSFNLPKSSIITKVQAVNNFLEIPVNPFVGSVERQEIIRFENVTGSTYTYIDTDNIQLPLATAGSSDTNNYYQGMFINIYNTSTSEYETHYITSYNVVKDSSGNITSKTITKSSSTTSFPTSTTDWYINSGVVKKNFSVPLDSQRFTILNFSRDNFSPLNLNLVSHNNQTYYKVKLLNLIIPNKIIKSSLGGSILNHPYLYVEFTNTNNSIHNKIYSNNPNSKKALFRATLNHITDIESSSFIKLDGDDIEQYLYFRPSDTIKFKVILPSGELLNTITQETVSPQEPEQLNQISAMFSIEKKV